MRKNYFVKLMNYMKNVYHIENGITKLTDGRVNPKIQNTASHNAVILGIQ